MRNISVILVLACALLAVAAACVVAQTTGRRRNTFPQESSFIDVKNVPMTWSPGELTIQGTVKDGSGKPLPGAFVGLKASPQAAADALNHTTTDSNGHYEFGLVDSGTWYVAAWRYGYAPTPDETIALTGHTTAPDLICDTKVKENIAPTYTALYATSEDPVGDMGKEQGADTNLGTRWTTANPLPSSEQDQSWTIDLGSVKTLTGITIFWENAYPSDYTIETTNDDPNPEGAPTWTTVYTATDSTGGCTFGYGVNADPLRFDPSISARGVRFHVTRFGPYPVYSCWEFQLHGTGPGNAYDSIAEVKQLPDNTPVEMLELVTVSGACDGGESALFRDMFWLEEQNRSCAIRVEGPGHYAWPGELDQVTGTVQTDSVTGERYIQASGWGYFAGTGKILAPYAMTGKAMTETSLPWALNVKAAGKVTEQLEDGYKLSDGSAEPIKIVKEAPLPPVGAFVVTEGALRPGSANIHEQKWNINGFIFQWLMHGAYSVANPGGDWSTWQQANLDQDFLATAGGEANVEPNFGDVGPNGGAWFGYGRTPGSDNYVFDLSNPPVQWTPSGQDHATIYASAWVLADRVYDGANDGLEVWVGSDDGYKIWVNGTAVGQNNVWRGMPGLESWDKIPAYSGEGDLYTLQPGWNRILIKVNNIYGGWGFGARLMKDNGANPLNLPYYSPIEYPFTP